MVQQLRIRVFALGWQKHDRDLLSVLTGRAHRDVTAAQIGHVLGQGQAADQRLHGKTWRKDAPEMSGLAGRDHTETARQYVSFLIVTCLKDNGEN